MKFSKRGGKYENDQRFQATAGNILVFVFIVCMTQGCARSTEQLLLAVLSVAGSLRVSAFYMSETQWGSAPHAHKQSQCVLARTYGVGRHSCLLKTNPQNFHCVLYMFQNNL